MRWKRKIWTIVLILLAGLSIFSMPLPADEVDDRGFILAQNLDPRLTSIIEKYRTSIPGMMARQDLPGLAVALVFGGDLIWAEGFGSTERDADKPATADTVFSIQSISKTYTATMVMAAADEGLVALDEPITTYLPGFTVNSRFESKPQEKITLRLLLSHHAGFTHEAPIGNNFDDNTKSLDEHFNSISDTWLKFPVGQRYSYSNLGIDLAGRILEVVYQRPFAELMSDELFEPLGLHRTTVDQDEIEQTSDRAIGHSSMFPKVPVRIPMGPSGGIYTSVKDMVRFMQFHLNGGQQDSKPLINKKILAAMYKPCCAGEDSSYGLGVSFSTSRFGDTVVLSRGHSGGGFSFLSNLYWFSELGVGIAILTNSDSNRMQRTLFGPLKDDIFATFLGEKKMSATDLETGHEPFSPDEARLKQVAGLYVGSRDVEFVMQDSQLGWNYRSKFYPVTFMSNDELRVKLPSLTLTCDLRSDGQRDPAWADCETRIGNTLRYTESLVHNASPYDPPGPDRQAWSRFLGDYEIRQWGKTIKTVNLHVENGHLFFGKYTVVDEYEPGLFFLSGGESLDLRGPVPTFRNIKLNRK